MILQSRPSGDEVAIAAFSITMFCDSLPRPVRRVAGRLSPRGIRQIAARPPAPGYRRYSDPGIVPLGRLSQ
jgi:hypothetical protein